MSKELFTRFTNNECISKNIDRVVKWLQNRAGTFNSRDIVGQIWDDFRQTGILYSMDYDRILDTIHYDAGLSRSDKRKLISPIDDSWQKVKCRFFPFLTRIYVVLIYSVIIILDVYIT